MAVGAKDEGAGDHMIKLFKKIFPKKQGEFVVVDGDAFRVSKIDFVIRVPGLSGEDEKYHIKFGTEIIELTKAQYDQLGSKLSKKVTDED